jgi:hypothetical protein
MDWRIPTSRTWQNFTEAWPDEQRACGNSVLTAIAIAREQTRSFELRAALTLAKLYQLTSYQSASRSQLCAEGFSPKPEFPEIAEAQALLAALA